MTLNLSVENKCPNMVCTGMRTKKTVIPARHDGPIVYISKMITVTACIGPIHKKCKYNVICKKMMKTNKLLQSTL